MPDKTDRQIIEEIYGMATQGLNWAMEDFHELDRVDDSLHYKAQGKKDAYRVILSTLRHRVDGLTMRSVEELKRELGAGCPFCGNGPIEPPSKSYKDEVPTRLVTPEGGTQTKPGSY